VIWQFGSWDSEIFSVYGCESHYVPPGEGRGGVVCSVVSVIEDPAGAVRARLFCAAVGFFW
jgi:hypothetical protein